jgi:hypothetical protein
LATRTSASGTTDPLASSTVPEIAAVADWPKTGLTLAHKIAMAASTGSTSIDSLNLRTGVCLAGNSSGTFTSDPPGISENHRPSHNKAGG